MRALGARGLLLFAAAEKNLYHEGHGGFTKVTGNPAPAQLSPGSRQIIGQRKGQQNCKKEKSGNHYSAGQLFARAFDVHEENYYQRGFNGSDQEGNDWIERTEVHECHGGRGRGENEKRYADRYVKYLRMSCVLVLDVSCIFVFSHKTFLKNACHPERSEGPMKSSAVEQCRDPSLRSG
jgi:hypothetical protein